MTMMTANITIPTTHPTTTPMTVEEEFSLLDCMPPDGITIAVTIDSEPVVDKVIEVVVTAVVVMVTPIVEGTAAETIVDISSVSVLVDCITVDTVVDDASTTSVIQNCETKLNFAILQLAKEQCNIIKTEM